MSLTNSPFWMAQTGGAFYDYEIDNSARFERNDNTYLLRNFSAGNRRTYTRSFWFKRSKIEGAERYFYSVTTSNSDAMLFETDERIRFSHYANTYRLTTSQKFRDVSAWYHIVERVDTTQGTASNRWRIYVNGVQVTAFDVESYPPQNYDTKHNQSGNAHHLMTNEPSSNNFSGYIAEYNYIDGQSLGPDNFGEFKSGVWIPKAYSGSYGTNGFYLKFANSVAFGTDSSGNSNTYTATNLSSYDQMPDTPTNNFCTMNILDDNYSTPRFSYSQGNLRYDYGYTGAGFDRVFGTHMIVPGDTNKYYMEFTGNVTNEQMQWGVVATDSSSYTPSDRTTGITGNDGINMLRWVSYGPAPYLRIIDGNGDNAISTTNGNAGNGDIFSIMYDAGTGKFYGWLNGVEFVGQSYASGTSLWKTLDTTKTYAVCMYQGDGGVSTKGGNCTANFGQDSSFAGAKTAQGNTDANGIGDFYYSVPTDALALCSANLPAPAIDPAVDDTPEDYFNTVLYTGNGGTQNVTGVGFQPDLIWIKNRPTTYTHQLLDVVRGKIGGASSYARLRTDSTAAEATPSGDDGLTTIGSDGFTVLGDESYNNSGQGFVSWNWKAGGTAVSNTDGSQSCSVSANTDAGFSIVKWTPSASTGTLGHGLGKAPAMIIAKPLASSNWFVQSTYNMTASQVMNLDTTGAVYTPGYAHFNSTFPTASVFSYGGYLGNSVVSGDKVAYCFAEKDGFSKIGSYVGNSNNDGTFVYTGFRPAWIMIKRTDSTNNWYIFNNKTIPYNSGNAEAILKANTVDAESNSLKIDLLSNGFKPRDASPGFNTGSYVYLAFAENPFKYANAR